MLRGTSRNASTTCTRQKGTGGPEAIYLLRLTERTLVDIEVVSEMDTVLAIRRVCDDPLTELACSDGPVTALPQMTSTAACSRSRCRWGGCRRRRLPGAANGRDAHLRASLEAGTYFLLVDAGRAVRGGRRVPAARAHASPPRRRRAARRRRRCQRRDRGWSTRSWTWPARSRPAETASARPALFYRAVIPARRGASPPGPCPPPATGTGPRPAALHQLRRDQRRGGNLCLASDRVDPQGSGAPLRQQRRDRADGVAGGLAAGR